MRRFLLVGLTGGIATGKSTVSQMFAHLGAKVVDADLLAREVVMPGQPALAEIAAEFGADVLQPDGHLDRKRLGAIVFSDPERRKRLEQITHPAIYVRQQRVLSVYEEEAFEGVVLWDAAVLIESGGHKRMDKLVVVLTDPATELARLMARDGHGGRGGARAHRDADAGGGQGEARRLRDRQLGHARRDRAPGARGLQAAPRRPEDRARRRAMSPRRNARATEIRRPAARGKTRALGQHFLRDTGMAYRIVELVAPTARDLVVEIGPGQGALTGLLASAAGRLVALEVDLALAARLRERFADSPHVDIADADARSFDYASLAALKPDPLGRVLAVGNLPYSVGKPILMALVEAGGAIDEMALMLQREVAERVAAAPGSRVYGSMSVLTQVACDVRLAFGVPPGAFSPPPQVDSAVIHLRRRAAPPVPIAEPAHFRAVVRAAFAQRRKNLANALAAGLGGGAERARLRVAAAGIDPGRRAETLSLAEFARLAEALAG